MIIFFALIVILLIFNVECFLNKNPSISFGRKQLVEKPPSPFARFSPVLRMVDFPLIPVLIGTAGVVFAVFNIENPVDLTDQGRAKARSIKRSERLARGEAPKSTEGKESHHIKNNKYLN
jgi:hypothetical protein